ncbi:unnamed protein product, partial [Adineta steineri]
IQSPQTSPPGQYLRITSATPQIVQSIQAPPQALSGKN